MQENNATQTPFYLSAIPAGKKITDLRYADYWNQATDKVSLAAKRPEDHKSLPKVGARDFLEEIASKYPQIKAAQSRDNLISALEGVAEKADFATDAGPLEKPLYNHYCGIRDTIPQLVELVKKYAK
ncbi:MAG: hypothetical protein AABX47_06995 [Nanoarchaeota archaeon]